VETAASTQQRRRAIPALITRLPAQKARAGGFALAKFADQPLECGP